MPSETRRCFRRHIPTEKMMILKTAPLKRRFAAILYEMLLVGAATCLAALLAGIAAIFLNPVSIAVSALVTSILIMGSWWLYFRANWHGQGQTLAMRTWRIGLCDVNGMQPSLHLLRLRFIWACIFIVFIPMLAYAGLRHLLGISPKDAFGAALIWLILPWGFALLNPDRQFLYDFLAGTRLVEVKGKP